MVNGWTHGHGLGQASVFFGMSPKRFRIPACLARWLAYGSGRLAGGGVRRTVCQRGQTASVRSQPAGEKEEDSGKPGGRSGRVECSVHVLLFTKAVGLSSFRPYQCVLALHEFELSYMSM